MPRSVGKRFEEEFIKSVPDYVLTYRLIDPPHSFIKNPALKFALKNPCDFFLYTGKYLYTLELKTTMGKFITFERKKDGPVKAIHYHQIDGLKRFSSFTNVKSGFILNFREYEKTFYLPINEFKKITREMEKSSLTISDIEKHSHILIEQTKKRTRYTYNIEKFLEDSKYILA